MPQKIPGDFFLWLLWFSFIIINTNTQIYIAPQSQKLNTYRSL